MNDNVTPAPDIVIPAAHVRSLVWDGDTLVDWVSGGERFYLDGRVEVASIRYAFPFDAAVSLPDGEYSVIYTRLATKGLVLRGSEVVREINRSFYHAGVYEYPIAVFRLASGRAVLAHCPDDYSRLEIEDMATGELLTRAGSRKPADFFHSRLAASADGRHLLSAGWIWHPVDAVKVFDVAGALADPSHLDGAGVVTDAWAEESSAAFLPAHRVAVWLAGVEESDGTISDVGVSGSELRLFDLANPKLPRISRLPGRLGAFFACGPHHVLALHGHPRLIDLRNGEVVASWTHIDSGNQTSSILLGEQTRVPIVAFDPGLQRLAIVTDAGIAVLSLTVASG